MTGRNFSATKGFFILYFVDSGFYSTYFWNKNLLIEGNVFQYFLVVTNCRKINGYANIGRLTNIYTIFNKVVWPKQAMSGMIKEHIFGNSIIKRGYGKWPIGYMTFFYVLYCYRTIKVQLPKRSGVWCQKKEKWVLVVYVVEAGKKPHVEQKVVLRLDGLVTNLELSDM